MYLVNDKSLFKDFNSVFAFLNIENIYFLGLFVDEQIFKVFQHVKFVCQFLTKKSGLNFVRSLNKLSKTRSSQNLNFSKSR